MDTPSTPGAATPSTATPAVSSAPSSASPAPASATPATPVAAPGTPATPPAVAAPTVIAADDPRSNEEIIRARLAGAFSQDGVGGTPRADGELDVNGDNGDVVVPPAGEGPQTPEEVAAAAAAATAAAAAAATPEDDSPFKDFSFDESSFGPEALSTALKADPAVQAALEANPTLKSSIFANARKAERAAKYDEILGSPDEARVAVQGHTAFVNVSNAIAAIEIGKPETAQAAIAAMLEQTAYRDDDGNPLKNEDGSLRTDGSVGRLFKVWFTDRLEQMGIAAKNKGDEDGQAAVDALMERAGLREPSTPNLEEMSEAQREQAASLSAREEALAKQEREGYQANLTALDQRVHSKTDTFLDSSLKTILDKATGLDAFSRSAAETKIRTQLRSLITGNPVIKSEMKRIDRMPIGAKREAAALKLNTESITTYLERAARKVLTEAGASVIKKAGDAATQQAARATAAQSESRGSLPSPPAPGASTASLGQVETDLTAKLGRRPSTEEILTERMVRTQRAA